MSRTARRRLALLGVPGIVVVVTLLGLVAIAGDLPDPVATHFGTDGVADGFTSAAGIIPAFVGMQVVLWGLLAALVGGGREPHVAGGRALPALPAGMVGFLGALAAVTLWPQRGLADASQVTLDASTVVVALTAGAVAWLLAGLVAPPMAAPDTTTVAPPADRPRVALDGAAVWQERTPTGRALPYTAAVIAALSIGLWWLAGAVVGVLTLLPIVAIVASTRFDVTIGPGGVVVRGILGFPRTHIPLEVIRDADVEAVQPFLQYGGWGWRHRSDRTAVVTVRGPGLLVTRTDGAQLIVSLDDATRAAGVLNRLLDQRGAGHAADAPT